MTKSRNAFYLGRSGIVDIQGLRVAYLSGVFAATAQARNCAEAQALISQHSSSGRIVDVLITSQLPQGVDVGAQPLPFSNSGSEVCSSSSLIAQVAAAICPRYHFSSFSNIAYERAPYTNPASSSSASFTRFISLADAFNTLSRKFIYAATIAPLHELDSPPPIPDGSTPSPYVTAAPPPPPPATSRLAKLEAAAAEISASSSYSRWGQPTGQPLGSQGRGGQGGRKRGRQDSASATSAACWFCLASPDVEKHLIVSVGDESYVALAKGGIDWNNLLIVPIDHVGCTLDLSAEAFADVRRYKESLRSYFASMSPPLDVVFMERNTFTKGAKHAHIQVFAVASGQGASIATTIVQYAGAHNMKFDSVDEEWQKHVAGSEYCVIELPEGGGILLHVVQEGGRFPVSFCREVMCVIMKTPDRVDWKLCASSRDEEENAAASFKSAFERHLQSQ